MDASPEMVEAARARGLDARLMDGQALTFEDEFDPVFSNAALHWMQQPDKVIAGVWRALNAAVDSWVNSAAMATLEVSSQRLPPPSNAAKSIRLS
jgi:trans-aconitate methyltransferase